MRKSICSLALMLLPALLLAGCSSSGPTTPTVQSKGIVQGVVLAGNGSAVAGADILVDDKATGIETNDRGYFEVSVTPGEHLITVVADRVKSRPYAVDGSENREIVIEIIPGEVPPLSDEEICRLYPRECEEPPGDEPPKDEPPMSDEEFCELYPGECEEPPKDEPPMSDEEFCELYPGECEEPPKDEPPMSEEEICELYPGECEEPPKEEPPMSDEEFCELYPGECEEPR